MTEQEQISVFDMFKVGIGPSSSHTLGPWRAAQRFLEYLERAGGWQSVSRVRIQLYGSLAKTGKGHGTDIALQLGLLGADPVTFDVNAVQPTIDRIREKQELHLGGKHLIPFVPETDLVFRMSESLPFHPNALVAEATMADGREVSAT